MEYKEADQDFDRAIFFLERKVARAAREFGFLNEGDHILVGLSGGKDSTVLLATLAMRQAWRKERYFLQACHVRGPLNERSSAGEDTERFLRALCERFGVQLHVVDADPLPPQKPKTTPSLSASFARGDAAKLFLRRPSRWDADLSL